MPEGALDQPIIAGRKPCNARVTGNSPHYPQNRLSRATMLDHAHTVGSGGTTQIAVSRNPATSPPIKSKSRQGLGEITKDLRRNAMH